jgi:hypothetical protein
MKNADMPAMPLPLGTETEKWCQGLTKREMMAMHILSGLLSDYEFDVTRQVAAEVAVQQADALLAELDRTSK